MQTIDALLDLEVFSHDFALRAPHSLPHTLGSWLSPHEIPSASRAPLLAVACAPISRVDMARRY